MSIKPQMPLRTLAVFWRNTEKSEAAMSLLWSADALIILDGDRKIGLFMQWNSILNESFFKCSFTCFFFYGLMRLKGLLLLKYIDGGHSNRETWYPSLSFGVRSLPQSYWLGFKPQHYLFVLWDSAWIQRSRCFGWQLKACGYCEIIKSKFLFDLILFQCMARGSRVLYRKAFVNLSWLLLMAILHLFFFIIFKL